MGSLLDAPPKTYGPMLGRTVALVPLRPNQTLSVPADGLRGLGWWFVCSLERNRTGRRTNRAVQCLWSEPEQAIELYDESAILQNGDAAHAGVSLIRIDNE